MKVSRPIRPITLVTMSIECEITAFYVEGTPTADEKRHILEKFGFDENGDSTDPDSLGCITFTYMPSSWHLEEIL